MRLTDYVQGSSVAQSCQWAEGREEESHPTMDW
jgi:hypothetical protein